MASLGMASSAGRSGSSLSLMVCRNLAECEGYRAGCRTRLAEVVEEDLDPAVGEQPPARGDGQHQEHDEQGEVPEPGPALIVVERVGDQPDDADEYHRSGAGSLHDVREHRLLLP